MDIKIDQEQIEKQVTSKVIDWFIDEDKILDTIRDGISKKIDEIFATKAQEMVNKLTESAFKNAFEKQYQKVDAYGRSEGDPTTIKRELDRIVGSYWAEKVDKSGNRTSNDYNSQPRAEYLMTQICAEDFSKMMKESAVQITGNLKDNFRGQMAQQMDQLLNSLFKVQSLQDQGKVEKPY